MVLTQVKNRPKTEKDLAKVSEDLTNTVNKVALETEKEKDSDKKEVQEIQRVLEPKRSRTHPPTFDDDEKCEKQSWDDWDLTDHRREDIHIQNHCSVSLGSHEEVPTPQEGSSVPVEHSRLGFVGWIVYWSLGIVSNYRNEYQ